MSSDHIATEATAPPRRRALTDLQLAELQIFRKVMEMRKSALAAEALGISGSAVSRAISRLEAATGKALFWRESNRLIPLPEALAFNRQIEPILLGIAEIETRAAKNGVGSTLRLATDATLASCFLPPLLAAFRAEHPQVLLSLSIVGGCAHSVGALVADGRADLGLSSSPGSAGVRLEPFRRSRSHVVLPQNHRLVGRASLGAGDLAHESLIRVLGPHESAAPLPPFAASVVAEVPCPAIAVDLVRSGLGISIIDPFPVTLKGTAGVALRPLDPPTRLSTNFVFGPGDPGNGAAALFADFVKGNQPENEWSEMVR